MDNTYELFKNGLTTTIRIKDHAYDTIEFTMKKHLIDEKGKELVNSGYTMFFSNKEFVEFWKPIIDDMKVRIENADSIQK
jgi:hypothetical protein